MKRIAVLLLSFCIVSVLTVPAAADMGFLPSEKEKVCVGTNGLDYLGWENDEVIHLPLAFGTVIEVIGKISDDDYYVTIPYPEGETTSGHMTRTEMDKTFPVDENVPPEIGEKLAESVKAEVTASPGLNLRYGPDVNFDSRLMIPEGAEITYRYTFEGWGCTDYEGTPGWVSLAYTKAIEEPAEVSPAEEKAETGIPDGSDPAADPQQPEPQPASDPAQEDPAGPAEASQSELPAVYSTVLICIGAAAVIAAAAVAIILIKAKRDRR